ncbi:MAG: sugar ABC transporter permease [Anaerolineales bacterium]|nr:sugar ABC transporter permease [Anaerolineales bacterium]
MSAVSTPQKSTPMNAISRAVRGNLQTYALVIAMIVIWLLFAALTNGIYLSARNFSNLFRQMTITAILSVGMVLVIVTGNIDLSVGKLAGYVSVVVATFQLRTWIALFPPDGLPPLFAAILSSLVGIGVGTLYGVLQGWIIAYLNVPAFIVTLGSMWALNGLILIQTEGRTIAANQDYFELIGQGYVRTDVSWVVGAIVVVILFITMFLGRQQKSKYGFSLSPLWMDLLKTGFFAVLMLGYIFVVNHSSDNPEACGSTLPIIHDKSCGLPIPVIILALCAVIVAYMSGNTKFGRHAYAIGGNMEASRLSGINIKRNIFSVFVLMGLLCGVSGVVMASYIGYGTIAAGGGYELDAIAACILGGTSTLGGVGTIFGAMVGALIMASLTNGLQILNVPSAWQYVVKGAVLIIAVYADVYFKKNR